MGEMDLPPIGAPELWSPRGSVPPELTTAPALQRPDRRQDLDANAPVIAELPGEDLR